MACLAARSTASLPRMPQCPGAYVEMGGSANEVQKNKYTLGEGVRGVNVLDGCKGGDGV